VVALAGTVLVRHRRLRRRLTAGDPPPPDLASYVDRQRRSLGIAQPVQVRLVDSRPPTGPAVVGVRSPVLVLPTWMVASWDEETFGPLVIHELVHLRRHDGWVNLVVTAVQLVYFFHPLVWVATWRFLRERERVCDDEVVAVYQGRSTPYVRALCRFALASPGGSSASALSSLAASRADLVRRVERLAEPGYRGPGRGHLLRALGAVALLAGLALSFGARGGPGRQPAGPGDVASLEREITERPDDVDLRIGVLDAYLSRQRPEDLDAVRGHVLHVARSGARLGEVGVLVLLEATRNDPWLLDETLAAWLAELRRQPDDLGLLRQTARLAAERRPELAASLARRGEALAADDPFWPSQLGAIAMARGRAAAGPARHAAFAEASLQFGRAAKRGDGFERLKALARAARAELALGRSAEARRLAGAELAEAGLAAGQWYEGDAVHEAHVLLGFAALAEGATEEAERELLAAAGGPTSPGLRSFGPDMSLAETLLGLGRTEAVLDYFEACRQIWDRGADRLDAWAAQVRRGEAPDFGANRNYYR